MHILIAGICGFVGSTIAGALGEACPEAEISGLDNLSRSGSEINRSRLQESGIRVLHGDTRNPSDLEPFSAVDYVIDAAANPSVLAGVDGKTSSRRLFENNLLGTLNLLELCRGAGAGFVLLSTSRVYSIPMLQQIQLEVQDSAFVPLETQDFAEGLSGQGVSESASTHPPVSLYGSAKAASERLALEYGSTFGFPVWINRCGLLAGAGQFGHSEQGIISFWIHSWRNRRPLNYIGFGGTGHQVRDVLHPLDLVPVLAEQMACRERPEHRIFNLSGGLENRVSLAGLSTWCRDRMGEHEVKASRQERAFDVPWLVLDSSRARAYWGWEPRRRLGDVLEEIRRFAEARPEWLELSSNPGKS